MHHDVADVPLTPGKDDSTLAQWHILPLESTAYATPPSEQSSFESTAGITVIYAPRSRARAESHYQDSLWNFIGAEPFAEPPRASAVELETHATGHDTGIVTPGLRPSGWLLPTHQPFHPLHVEFEVGHHFLPTQDPSSQNTLVRTSQGDRHARTPLNTSPLFPHVQPAAAAGYLGPASNFFGAIHCVPGAAYLDQSAEDFALALSHSFSTSTKTFARTLRDTEERLHQQFLRSVVSFQSEDNTVREALISRFVTVATQYSKGDSCLRQCADLLMGAGLSALAERVVELDRLVREEGDDLDVQSLRLASNFLAEHREFGAPQLSVTPRGEIQALWRNTPEGALIVMDFLGDASVRYAALATDRHPSLHSDSTRGLAPASRAMDELKSFLESLSKK